MRNQSFFRLCVCAVLALALLTSAGACTGLKSAGGNASAADVAPSTLQKAIPPAAAAATNAAAGNYVAAGLNLYDLGKVLFGALAGGSVAAPVASAVQRRRAKKENPNDRRGRNPAPALHPPALAAA